MEYDFGLPKGEILGARFTSLVKNLVDANFDFGLTQYPIFDEEYRYDLNKKLLHHYMFHEIGYETPGMFRDRLNCAMNEIMPYYNQLYSSELLKIEPFLGFSHTEEKDTIYVGKSKSEAEGKSKSTGNNKNVFSNTPQNFLATVTDPKYASEASITDNTVDGETGSKVGSEAENTEKFYRRFYGYNQNQSLALIDFRKTFLNIDLEVIENPKIYRCFMAVY